MDETPKGLGKEYLEEKQPKRMTLKEFRELGFLQELNRRFLHPLGLALSVLVSDDEENEAFGGVLDYRDDPEGIVFSESVLDTDEARRKRDTVVGSFKDVERTKKFGWAVQPIPEGDETEVEEKPKGDVSQDG